jgi:IclR family KDG regulon transcriptional repressor
MKESHGRNEVGVIIKSMNLLCCLAVAPQLVVELSKQTGITKPTVYRILDTLNVGSFVVRNSGSRKYTLGPTLVGLGRATRNFTEIIRNVRPTIMELRKKYNETVNLGVLNNGKVIYLITLESEQHLGMTVPVTIHKMRKPPHLEKQYFLQWKKSLLY